MRKFSYILLFCLVFLSPQLIAIRSRWIMLVKAQQQGDPANYYLLYGEFAQPKCVIHNQTDWQVEIYCFEFNSWPEVVALMNSTVVAADNTTDLTLVRQLAMKPSEAIVLTGELDLSKLYKLLNPLGSSSLSNAELGVEIGGLKGLDVVSGWRVQKNKVKSNDASKESFSLTVDSSFVAFYMGGHAPGDYDCKTEKQFMLEYKINLTAGTVFNYFSRVEFLESVKYDQTNPVCPYLFTNANLYIMGIAELVNSFLVTNIFRLQHANTSSSSSINSTVSTLYIHGYNFILDESLLHPLVFERVKKLQIFGSIGAIQVDLFKASFKQLRSIWIQMNNLANFFHQVGLKWAGHLANDVNITWIEFKQSDNFHLAEWLDPGVYTYPDSDLCIFSPLSLRKKTAASVVPIFYANSTVCTDTMAWLSQNYRLYNLSSHKNFLEYSREIYATCWEVNKTNMSALETKINQCLSPSNVSQTQKRVEGAGNYKIYPEYYEIVYTFQFSVDLLAFILIPFACALGILLNLRVIYIIHQHNKVELKEDFYKYMSLNSVFNCLFCTIYALYPVNYCLKYETGYFCSAVYKSVAAQFIKIVLIGYFGEAIKMRSNISYIFITINRYMLVGKEHSKTLERLSKLEMKYVIYGSVVFSLLMNIGHCFQYRINWGWGALLLSNKFTYDLYPSIVMYNSSFQVYSIVYFVINFAVFLFVNTWVEMSIVLKIRAEIAEKRAKAQAEIELSTINNTSESVLINKLIKLKQKKIEKDAKKETRAIIMVVTNSCVNFFLRLPEILAFFASKNSLLTSFIFTEDLSSNSVIFDDLTSMILSTSYFLFIATFTTNVVIYYLFNQKFKQLFVFWTSYANQE